MVDAESINEKKQVSISLNSECLKIAKRIKS